MKRHIILILGLALLGGACASAGGGPGGQDSAPADYTGPTPTEDIHTQSANLFLAQAFESESPDEQRDLFAQALETAQEGITEEPENPLIWFIAAQAQAGLGDYVAADSLYAAAKELYPYYESVDQARENAWIDAYNQGVTALQEGDSETALQHMERAAMIYEGRPDAHLQLGSLYAQRGETEDAIEAYRTSLEIMRGSAVEELDSATTQQWDQNEEIAAFNLGQLLAQSGRDEEAIQAYEEFLERNPDNTSAKINLAVVLSREGRAAEAGELYSELLSNPDLTAEQYLMTGIGLFQAEEHERAANAFRQSLEMNPYSRDARYNLAQALYVRTTELESQRDSVEADAEVQAINDELAPIYPELRDVLSELIDSDPYNRNAYALLARAYRGLADLEPDPAQSDSIRQQALDVLNEHEALPADLTSISVSPRSGSAQFTGEILNINLDAGAPITLRFTVLGSDGSTIGEQEVTVTAPEPDQATVFNFNASLTGDMAGWRYEPVE